MEPDDLVAHRESRSARDHAELFSAVFGDSDTDEESSDHTVSAKEVAESFDGCSWEKVEVVEGLWHCSQFLSVKQQQVLLKAIRAEGWFSDPQHNQAMKFGDLPVWAVELSALIRRSIYDQKDATGLGKLKPDGLLTTELRPGPTDNSSPLPSGILEREPLFDQMIVNLYQPGEGIKAHVDLLRFEDGIAIVSLESTCVMAFRSVDTSSTGVEHSGSSELISGSHQFAHFNTDLNGCGTSVEESLCGQLSDDEVKTSSSEKISQVKLPDSTIHKCAREVSSNGVVRSVEVLLKPGDLIVTYGPARYNWTHEINRDMDRQLWQGRPILQQTRVSVTLRRLSSREDVN